MIDEQKRTIDYLRVSITDRCNLRCVYCMPECGIQSLGHENILTYEEILMVCHAAARLGIQKIKLTGGEPLSRLGIEKLISGIHQISGIREVTMTTNGVLIPKLLPKLLEAGLNAVNISLDTRKRDVFHRITRRDEFDQVMIGIKACTKAGIRTKINCVPIEELNGTEITDLAALAKEYPVDVRFIELMPIGLGKSYSPIPTSEIKRRLSQAYGNFIEDKEIHGNGPANYWKLPDFQGSIGFISAISHEFCGNCNRVRLTSDGQLKLCLHYSYGINLKQILRSQASEEELYEQMKEAIRQKPVSHHFGQIEPATDERNMVQIGG